MKPKPEQKGSGLHAVKWALVDKFGAQLVLLVNMLVLARLLSPEDFGLVGILYIFLSVAGALVDSGMGGGLIRKQDMSDRDTSTFFYFNMAIALLCYLAIFIAAPYIAAYYHQPSLLMLAQIMALGIIINAFGLVQRVLLIRALAFKLVTRASLISSVFSTVFALLCALKGMGIFSLVVLQLSQSTLNTFFLCVYGKWAPKLIFSISAFKELFSFGFSLLLTAMLNIFFANIYQPIIGRYFSIAYAGFYYQAKRLYEVPVLTISQVVDSVTYPILVRYQHDRAGLESRYRKIVTLLVFSATPVVVMISIFSRDIVWTLLGEKWLPSAKLLAILSFSGIFQILETTSGSLLKVEGRTRLIFRLELLKKTIILFNIILFCRWGIVALMFGIVANSVISFAINQYFTSIKIVSYKKMATILINAFLMGLMAFLLKEMISNVYLAMVIAGSTALLFYLLLGYLQRLPEQIMVLGFLSGGRRSVAKP